MICYLGLGSNLADRFGALLAAAQALAKAVEMQKASTVYETIPEGNVDQPLYLNAALRVGTDLSPWALLKVCLEVEARLGRVRSLGAKRESRVIDIDLLLHGETCLIDGDLFLPHPRLLDRPFVRIPLAEVALPDLRHPVTHERLDRAFTDTSVRPMVGLSLAV